MLLKKTILSIVPLYISTESSAFQQIIKAIEDIPDEKFVELKDQQSSTIHHRINFLIDEIIFFINRYYPITKEQGVQLDVLLNEIKRISLDLIFNNQTMIDKISNLENRLELLENEQNQIKKLRIIAQILTPLVKEIRNIMLNQQIPDEYYSKPIINCSLLRTQGKNISWEISDFNEDNDQKFDINLFNAFEQIIKDRAEMLGINYNTLLELLYMKFDRTEIEDDLVRNFLRHNSADNASFNSFLTSMNMTDAFNINEKLCLDILYRNYFFSRYYSIQ